MPVQKDIVETYYLTTDVPVQYGGAAPTWNQYKGTSLPERIGDGSEHPTEEPVQQGILDGRQVHASVEAAFTQMIMELSDSDTLFTDLKTAALENMHVWIRRDGLATASAEEIIGGSMGLTVSLGRVRQGSEGHRIFQALFEGAHSDPGGIIEPFSGGS